VVATVTDAVEATWDVDAIITATNTSVSTWNVAATITPATQDATWNALESTVETVTATWDAEGQVEAVVEGTWNVAATITDTSVATWNVYITVTDTSVSTWNAAGVTVATQDATWDLSGSITDTATTTWEVFLPVSTLTIDPWDITEAVFVASKSVAAQDTSPHGLAFSPDGTKMFVAGYQNGGNIHRYDLGTAWDVTTATYVSSKDVSAQDAYTGQVTFSADGLKMYTTGLNSSSVHQYTLSTAWDITGATFASSEDLVAQVASSYPLGVAFNTAGTVMFVVGATAKAVYSYDLGTAWDVTTSTYVATKSVSAQDTSPTEVEFSTDGRIMFVLGDAGNSVYRYDLSTAWDLTTATYTATKTVSAQGTSPGGLAFSGDGTKMFVMGWSSDAVHSYDIASPRTATWGVLEALTDTQESTWDLDETFVGSSVSTWSIDAVFTTGQALTWDTLATTTDDVSAAWNVYTPVSDTADFMWDLGQALVSTTPSSWNLDETLAFTGDSTWNVDSIVNTSTTPHWDVLVSLSESLESTWEVFTFTGDTTASTWDLEGRIQLTQDSRWSVRVVLPPIDVTVGIAGGSASSTLAPTTGHTSTLASTTTERSLS